jgi:RNA polymerase sigma-54 factor
MLQEGGSILQLRHARVDEHERPDRQPGFNQGFNQPLKVLRMNDLAEELSCDPSTISRTVAEKYMQTPRGIYPLRMFFTGGTETAAGQSTSWDSLKAASRRSLTTKKSGTSPGRPLSHSFM